MALLLLNKPREDLGELMDLNGDFPINQATYQWTGRIISTLKKMLRVNLKLHQNRDQVHRGDIFLFNHFTRFETFIPQYVIYRETGALCRTVAGSNFFIEGSPFSNYLLNIGGVPNNHPRLLAFLAEEILRGRKVIIFPEGRMLKDRRVLDGKVRYPIFFAPTPTRLRKHHSGAAVLALGLNAFKSAVLGALESGKRRQLEAWAENLRIPDVEKLIAAARRPTIIVPANITFYPIRVNDNIIHKIGELLARGLNRKLSEELLIEGNILLRDTDMDIRLGDPVDPEEFCSWWERQLIGYFPSGADFLDDFFRRAPYPGPLKGRIGRFLLQRKVPQIRNECMTRMYAGVTVNLSHLASLIILSYLNKGQTEDDQSVFHKSLYLAVKRIQKDPSIFLHRSLKNPEAYNGLIHGQCYGLDQFLKTIATMDLVLRENGRYHFLPKLRHEHELDEVRLENLVVVYANEVAPISEVTRSVNQAIEEARSLDGQTLAKLCFDDELLTYDWDRQTFSKTRYREINDRETASESGAPFLYLPERGRKLGVVLVHGFLASPAEVRPFGERLKALGYPVLGVRLKGHGTSPWDLRKRTWEEWLESIRRCYRILSAFVPRICLIGFSAGGALSLRFAAEPPEGLAGVGAVCVPLKFRDRNMIFVPLVHGANQFVRKVSSFEGIMAFRPRPPEHPHINYQTVPIRGLYELGRLVDEVEERLPDVHCPVKIIQGTDDPIVDPRSAEFIYKKLGTHEKEVLMIAAARHGILYEDIGGTQERLIAFLEDLSASDFPDYSVPPEKSPAIHPSQERSA